MTPNAPRQQVESLPSDDVDPMDSARVPSSKRRVLFLCTGNSCRSQMAEGWARALWGGDVEVVSAGIEAHGLNPLAVQVMQEAGVDIRGQWSKTLADLEDLDFDLVITVCGHAQQQCPTLVAARRTIHVGFDDPPRLALQAADQDEALAHYRRVRDEIRQFVEGFNP